MLVRQLAKEECTNYRCGYCVQTDEPCHLVLPRCDSIPDGQIGCGFFPTNVIPPDWDLNDLVMYAMWYGDDAGDDAEDDFSPPKRCVQCDGYFIPIETTQQYCRACMESMKRASRCAHDTERSD